VAAVRELNRLELVVETLRAALEALAAAAPSWLLAMVPEDWYQRYGQRASDYRLPQATAARAALAVMVGRRVRGAGCRPRHRRAGVAAAGSGGADPAGAVDPAVLPRPDGLRWRGKQELPPAALAIDSPMTPTPATASNAA